MEIRVPQVHVEHPHWKVGDELSDSGERYVLGQLALIYRGEGLHELVWFDSQGKERARMQLWSPPGGKIDKALLGRLNAAWRSYEVLSRNPRIGDFF